MITRRAFTTTALAACSRPLAAAGKLNLGIGTYTYHSLSIDDMIVQLKRLETREIEMSRGEFMLFSKPTPEKFQSAKAKFDAAGIRCVSYYTATIKNDRDLDNALRGAVLLGARNITGDILQRIDERCTKEGLTFGIHNHYFKQKFAYESPEDVLRGLAGPQASPPSQDGALERRSGVRRRNQRASRKGNSAYPGGDAGAQEGQL